MLLCEYYKFTRATPAQIKLFKGVLVRHIVKHTGVDEKVFENQLKSMCDIPLSKSTKEFSKYQIEEAIERSIWIMEELGINIYKE